MRVLFLFWRADKLLRFLPHLAAVFILLFWLSGYPYALSAQELENLFQQTKEALENGDLAVAEQKIADLFRRDSLYQDQSGKSVWCLKGQLLEFQQEPLQAIQILEKGRERLARKNQKDLFLEYHLARLYGENRIAEKDKQITSLMYDVARHLDPQRQREAFRLLVDQLAWFLSPEERERFRKARQPSLLLYRKLRSLDPNPVTSNNEFLPIFFQRIQEARRRYPDKTTVKGYDIRGDLLVRLGEPWKVYTNHSGLLGDVGYAIYPFEVWFFTQIHPELYFTLLQERGHGYYRLVDGPESVLGTFYKGKRAFFNKLRPGETATYLRLHLYEELAAYHQTFRRRIDRIREQMTVVDAADYARSHFPMEDYNHRILVDTLLAKTAPVLNEIYNPLQADVSLARFYQKDQGRLECYFAVPNDQLLFKKDSSGYHTDLSGIIAVLNENYEPVKWDSLNYRFIVSRFDETLHGRFIGQWQVTIPPGNYRIYLNLFNKSSSSQFVYRDDVTLQDVPEDSLHLSDIQLAVTIEPASQTHPAEFVKNHLFISPLVGDPFQRKKCFLYAELLVPERIRRDGGEFEFTVKLEKKKEQRNGVLRILSLFKKSRAQEWILFNEKIPVKNRALIPIYRKIDFSEVKSGNYVMQLEVTHLPTGEQTATEKVLK